MHNVDVRNVSLGQIMYFVKTAEYGNITKAADYFYLSQPTLSRKINSLEAQLDLQLFIRHSKSLSLTPAGKYLMEQWKGLVTQVEEEIQHAHILQTGTTRSLVIAYLDSFRQDEVLLPLLDRFSAKYPDIAVRVEADSASRIRQMLIHDKADVIISILYDFDAKDFSESAIHWTEFNVSTHCACMLKTNPLADREAIDMSDLKESHFICISPHELPEYTRMLQALCNACGFSPDITNYVNSASSLTMNLRHEKDVFVCDRNYLDWNREQHCIVPIRDTRSSMVLAWKEKNDKNYLADFVEEVCRMFGCSVG